ncbi:hypothetical protein [Pyrodictium abyssi]|uniref:Major facilitator superfamily (MFS) profile domain-containing protein n=1 Tax=Pyrodictium abyssi TaxID=54256 RepID=A0ABM8ITS5_9CREN|nr:hypothetical protein PABY_05060 [Pyrodictium abyssi]
MGGRAVVAVFTAIGAVLALIGGLVLYAVLEGELGGGYAALGGGLLALALGLHWLVVGAASLRGA